MNGQYDLGDIVRLRKKHPCGSYDWLITRLGVDIGLVCQGCDRRIMMPRSTFSKRVKMTISRASEPSESDTE